MLYERILDGHDLSTQIFKLEVQKRIDVVNQENLTKDICPFYPIQWQKAVFSNAHTVELSFNEVLFHENLYLAKFSPEL